MQKAHSKSVLVRLMAVLALIGALVLTACPSDDTQDQEDRDLVNFAVPLTSAATAASLGGETFTFTGGVTEFGTTGTSTNVVFTSAAASTIAAGGSSTPAAVTYASCTFTPAATSTFPATSPLRPNGPAITITTCRLEISSTNVPVDSNVTSIASAVLVLNTVRSAAADVVVTINDNGTLTVNNTNTNLTVPPRTGTTGTGGA